jgi:outer membrane protein assembly factor BamB
MPVDLPAWGTPALSKGQLVIGLGNGNLLASDPKQPAGAVLCLLAETGIRVWRRDLPDSVLGRPYIWDQTVLCGSRDGHLYCFDLDDGRPRWRTELEGPVVGSPAGIRWVVKSPVKAGEMKSSIGVGWDVCTTSTKGLVASASLKTGELRWKLDLVKHTHSETRVLGSPAVALAAGPPRRHQILVGAGVGSEIARFPVLYCLEASEEAVSQSSPQR